MQNNSLPAILLLTFNRPGVTKKVFDSIKKIKPSKLYIAQDGPRNQGDIVLIQEVREIFNVDRTCELKLLYRDTNLGCRDAVVGGIDRFFEHEKFGIILEDDCIISQEFVSFCEMCNKLYVDQPEIGTISGSNYQQTSWNSSGDYFFSRQHPLLRGRATRKDKRALYKHDTVISNSSLASDEVRYFSRAIQRYGSLGYRDNNWYSTLYTHKLYTIVPSVNLITNIGHEGIHTQRAGKFHDLPIGKFDFSPLYMKKKNILSYRSYDTFMKEFILKMYIYTKIENILKNIGIYTFIHKIFLKSLHYFKKHVS